MSKLNDALLEGLHRQRAKQQARHRERIMNKQEERNCLYDAQTLARKDPRVYWLAEIAREQKETRTRLTWILALGIFYLACRGLALLVEVTDRGYLVQ